MLDFSVQFNLIAFCVVVSVGAILLVGGVVTAVTIKRKHIGIVYVLYYILSWLALIAGLGLSLFALIGRFGLFGLSLGISGSDVTVSRSGQELFPVPFMGAAVEAVTGAIMMEITVYVAFAAALFSVVICPFKWRRKVNDYIIPVRRPSEGDGYITVDGAFYCPENALDDEPEQIRTAEILPKPAPAEPEPENAQAAAVIAADTLIDYYSDEEIQQSADETDYVVDAVEPDEEERTVEKDEPVEVVTHASKHVVTDVKPEPAEEKETLPQIRSFYGDYMPDLSMIKTIVRRPRRNPRRVTEDDETERVTVERVTDAEPDNPPQGEIKSEAQPTAKASVGRRRRTVVKSNAAKAFGEYINSTDEEEQKRLKNVVDTIIVPRDDD